MCSRTQVEVTKYELVKSQVRCLGYVISPLGIRSDPDKIQAVKDFTIPTNVKKPVLA